MTSCRLCGESLAESDRLRVAPAPAGAQAFAATAAEALSRSITLEIVACRMCGLVQSASPPVDGYRRAITAAGVSGPVREHRRAQALRLVAMLGRSGSRIALVGCGNGYELPILADCGFDPVGIEWGGPPNGYTGHWSVLDGYPERGSTLPGAPYDAFVCYNFLEHAVDPRGFLVSIAESLRPDGYGVVEVPNYAAMRKQGRSADYIADHLSYFDADTFRAILSTSGFTVRTMTEMRDGENLEAVVSPRQAPQFTAEAEGLDSARRAASEFFARWRTAGTPALAWGASHQALTLLAGVADADRPSVILDSAPFKRGLFAPPTGIPVAAPTREALAGAGAVLVIAAGFEAEIAHQLRSTLGFAGEIWTMRGHVVHRLG